VAVTNVTLEVVQREYHSLREGFPKFCGCETCHSDVVVYGLKSHFPHYVSTRQGEILTELTLAAIRKKRSSTSPLLEGFRRSRPPRAAAQNPRNCKLGRRCARRSSG